LKIDNNISIIDVFEHKLQEYLKGEKHIVALNSGTSAIHLALILSGIKKEDEVICQSFTFSASVNPILYTGATPVFVDSETDTWNMCPVLLEQAILDRVKIGKKPKAIIVVHSYGMPAKIDQIVAIAKKHKIILIEDAAEAVGSDYKGQKCGTFGDFGILSFNNNKILTTFGGGALKCTTESQKKQAIFLATQAKEKSIHFQHKTIGYNYRMSPVLAAIGVNEIGNLPTYIHKRKSIHHSYQTFFNEFAGISVFKTPNLDYDTNYWLSCIVVDSDITGFTKEDIRKALASDNIESRPLWKPMHLQPIFKQYPYYGKAVCETLFKNGLSLPSSTNLSDIDFLRIKKSINKLL